MKAHRLLHVIYKAFAFAILFSFQALAQFTGAVPVVQNFTTEDLTFLTILKEPGQSFTYEISPKSATFKIKTSDVGHKHQTDILEITGLTVGTEYQLTIKNKAGDVVDAREFKPVDQTIVDPKAALCSCSRVGLLSPDDKQRSMWDRIMDQKPNAIMFLGDIVYGDNALQAVMKFLFNYHPSIEQIKKRFITSWKTERLYRQQKLIPLYSIWDDHDFGFEAANAQNPFKKEMLRLFRAYFPIPETNSIINHGPGVAFSFNLFGKKILMLDNRSFFNPKDRTFLGMEQVQWIESEIKDQKEVIIASGMGILKMTEGKHRANLADDAPTEWEAFRGIFQRSSVRAVFLTGDVHYSEVRFVPKHVLGFETMQGVFSHLHSTPPFFVPPFRTGKQQNDPNQKVFVNGRNFAILSLKDIFKKMEMTFHRSKSLEHILTKDKDFSPIHFVQEFENIQCERFYKTEAL